LIRLSLTWQAVKLMYEVSLISLPNLNCYLGGKRQRYVSYE